MQGVNLTEIICTAGRRIGQGISSPYVRRTCVALLFAGLGAWGGEASPSQAKKPKDKLIVGAERLDVYIPQLIRKRVAVVSHLASRVRGVALIETLQKRGVEVRKAFCPEHSCASHTDAGEAVESSIDKEAGVRMVSLYGHTKKPTAAHLADIDVVVFDLQDVGARFYTYLSTLHYVMEACAEQGKQIMVLDRPNPNGNYIDGPLLEPAQRSFVGLHSIPIVHGMTMGELARMINGEGWLADRRKADLTVIEMLHYTHQTPYTPPIPPSPNLPTLNAIRWYPSLCLFEGTVISVARGTLCPFEAVGHPALAATYSFHFTPRSIEGMAKRPLYENQVCYGVDLTGEAPPTGLTLKYLIEIFAVYRDKDHFFNPFFEKLAGGVLKEQIKAGMTEREIKESWQDGLVGFKKLRARYTLYAD